MKGICYLILHYKGIEDTIQCVESIKETSGTNIYNIVIVDNGSGNGTGEQLKNIYMNEKNIYVLLSINNIGFSRGNNLGYKFIKENLNPAFLIVTNSDVIFYQKDLYKLIKNIYQENQFHVLGPDIYVRENKEHQSPLYMKPTTVSQVQKEIEQYEFYQKHLKLYVLKRKLQIIKNQLYSNSTIFKKIYNILKRREDIDYSRQYKNVGVQGACIVFSNKYIKAEDKLFSPETFLYCEELLLYQKCHEKGYLSIYDPRFRIYHEDSASIKKITKNSLDKAKFTLEHHVLSRKLLLNYLKGNE